MDWMTVLVNEQHQRDLMRQAEHERMARALQQSANGKQSVLNRLARALLLAAQRPQHLPETDMTAPRLYRPAEQG